MTSVQGSTMSLRRHSSRCRPLVVVLLIALYSSTFSLRVQATTADGEARSLSLLVSHAHSGDTLYLTGTYSGNVVVDKPLVLLGDGDAVIEGADTGNAVTLQADGCTVRGVTVRGGGRVQLHDEAGIKVRSHYNLIEDCRLEDNLFGIYFLSSNYNVVRRVTICGRNSVPENERGNGIHLHDSRRNLIDSVHIISARDGIYFDFADSNVVLHTCIEKLRYGVHYMFSQANIFEYCTLTDNVAGAALMYSNYGLTFRNNLFVHNVGYRAYGILYKDCNKGFAENNIIVDNTTGLFFDNSHKNLIRKNIIALSGVAIRFSSSSEYDAFYENNFLDNISPLVISGGKAEILWDSGTRGNYWSNARGYDLDANGISDIPHNVQGVFDCLQGEYPLFSLYVYSPAAQAMEFAERTVPVMSKGNQIDRFPLMKAFPMSEELLRKVQRPSSVRSGWSVALFSCMLLGMAATILSILRRWTRT